MAAPINGCLRRSTEDLSLASYECTLQKFVASSKNAFQDLRKLVKITKSILNDPEWVKQKPSDFDLPANCYTNVLVRPLGLLPQDSQEKPRSPEFLKQILTLLNHYRDAENVKIRRKEAEEGAEDKRVANRKMFVKLKGHIETIEAEIAQKKKEITKLQKQRMSMEMSDIDDVIKITNQISDIDDELLKLGGQLERHLKVFAKYEPEPSVNDDDEKEIEENVDEAVLAEAVMKLLTLDAPYSKAASPSPASTEIENENVSDE